MPIKQERKEQVMMINDINTVLQIIKERIYANSADFTEENNILLCKIFEEIERDSKKIKFQNKKKSFQTPNLQF